MVGTPRSQDPLPEYVSPELVRLIAKNAPAELDFFVQYLTRPKQSPRAVPWRLHRSPREVQAERERETRAAAVEELLRGIKERNDWIAAKKGQGGYQSFSAQQTARSDLETLSSTRSSPPKRTSLLSRERELRNVSLEGLESNVTRILGRDFCLTKQSERVHWPLPPEARHRSRDADDFPYHRIRKRGFESRQALEDLPPPSAKFKDFFIGKTVSRASSNSSDDNSESLSPPARRQRLPLKKTVPGEWETFESDIHAGDRNSGYAFKQDRFFPFKPKASATIKWKGHAAWIPPGKPCTVSHGGLPPMGPHSRPSSARLPIGNRPASPAWVPPGQPSRRPVSAPSGPTISKSVDAKNGSAGKVTTCATEPPEIFKRAWEDFKDSEDFDKKPSTLAYVKPWRRGMATNATRPVVEEKKSHQMHQEKLSEVIKFMEAKQSQRRKEQRDLKRKAEEEVAAKKEKERLLQLHHQAMLEMEAEQAKDKLLKVRPAWNPDFDAARADGIGPWASPENNLQGRRKGTPTVAVEKSCDAQVVTDSTDDTNPVSKDSTEETDSVRSRNIHVVLRPKKRGKGKSRQRKAHKPTKPKDPFDGSKKRARWKNSTNMNAYGGKDALKRRELMKIYGVLQVQPNLPPLTEYPIIPDKRQQREAVDSRKHCLRSLQGGVKKGTSSRKTAKGKAKGKAWSGQRDESVIRPPKKSERDVSQLLRKEVTQGSQPSRASNKGNTQLTTRLVDVKQPIKERNIQAPTPGGNKALQGKLGMANCSSRKRKEQPDVQDRRPQHREPTKSCTITAAASTTKQRKLQSPPLVYFSDQAQISDATNTLTPFKEFPSTLRPTSPSNKSHSFERDRKKISGGGFHFKSATKPLPATQKGRIDVRSTKSGVETGIQLAGTQSERVSTPSMRASYSALAIAQGPRYCASSMKEAFDLNELEQAGSPLERQTSNQKSVKLSRPSSTARPSKQSSAETLSNSQDVSLSYHGSTLPTNRLSMSAPSSLLEEKNWQKEKICHDSHEKGQIFKKMVMQQKFEDTSNEKFSPPRDKFDKEWTMPRRGDSFSIVNLYAKHKAQERDAQETKNAARFPSGVPADVSHQKRRPSTTGHLFGRNLSPTSSSEFKTYVAAHYGGNISNLSESETLFSEIMAEMSGKKRRLPLRKPATADFIRSIQMDLAKTNASTEGRATTSHANGLTIPGLSRENSKSRVESEEHIRTMNTCVQKFKVPTAMEMPSTGMQRKLHSKLPELSVDGVSVLSTSKARMRESYTDMFSYDDSEALALFKVRTQLRKEQRLVRKLRRMQKLDGAGLQQSESGTRTRNHNMLKEHEKGNASWQVPEGVLDLKVSASQRLPLRQKSLRPPNHPRVQVQKHPPRTRMKKRRLQHVKLDTQEGRKPGHGLARPLNGVGHKKERKSSVVKHKSLLEKKIQQLTTQISEVTEKRLFDDQQKCEITSRSFFEPNTSFMTFTLDETKRKSISSAVKIISVEDIASDSSHGKVSPQPAKEKCTELEQSLSNRGGYSDSFLSEGSIFEKNHSSRSMPATHVTDRIRKEFSTGNRDRTTKDKMHPDSTECPPDKIYHANVHEISDKKFEVQKLNTPVMHIGKVNMEISQHGGHWKQMKKVEVPNQSTASAKTEACRFLDANQKDMDDVSKGATLDVSKDATLDVKPTSCDERGIGRSSLLALTQSNISQPKSQNHSRIAEQGDQGNCHVDIVNKADLVEDKKTPQTGSLHNTATTMDADGGGLVTRIKGPTSFRKAEVISKEIESIHSRFKDPQNNMETQHSFEQAALEIEEDIMPVSDSEQNMQHEIVTDGLSTVELPSFQQNLREVGHLFLAHSPSKHTSMSSKRLGHDFQDSMHTKRLHGPETSGPSVKNNMSGDRENSGESNENRILLQTTKRAEDGTDKPLKQEAISESSDPEVASTGSTTDVPLTIEPSQVDTCESIPSQEVLCVQAPSSIEEEDHLQRVSSQVRSVNTVSYTNAFSSRRPSTKQTANYRQDDDNDNESTKSINSPFRTVDGHQEPEDPEETICHVERAHYSVEGRQTESAPPKGGFQDLSYSSSECQNGHERGFLVLPDEQEAEEQKLSFSGVPDENSCLRSSEVTDNGRKRHEDTGRPESSADNVQEWNDGPSLFSASNASQNDAYCAGSHGSPERAFADSDMSLVSQEVEAVQHATENERVSTHEKKHESKADGDPDSIFFHQDTSVLGAPTTVNEHKNHDTMATGTGGDTDEDEIPEDIICEDLDTCAEVSASSVHENESHSEFNNIWIHNDGQCQNDESKGDMIRQEQEEVASMSSDNAKVNKAACSDEAIPKTVCKQAKQTTVEMAEASDGPNTPHETWTDCHGELSSSLLDVTKSTSADWTAAPVTNVGEQHVETGDELSISFESRQSEQLCDTITHKYSDGSTGKSSDKLRNFSDLVEKMPVTEETKKEKYNLLADLLTSTLLDGMLQAELSDTVGQNIRAGRQHDPLYNSSSTFSFRAKAEPSQQGQSTRKGPLLPKQLSPCSINRKGVKVSNQAAVRRYQTRGVLSRRGSSEDDNCSPGSLSPSYAAEYVQNLLSLQDTEATETQKMVMDECNQTTLDRSHPESQYMYDKLLLDAVNDSFLHQTTSFNPVPQLTSRKTYNVNAFKPISACNALKTALASITDDDESANTARSPGEARCLLKKQVLASCEEWQMSWLEANELLVNELADGILTEMVGSMILDMPERGTRIR